MESKNTPNLARVVRSIDAVPKDTTHALGYTYASVDAVFSAVRGPLAEEGITIRMDEVDIFPLDSLVQFKFRIKFEPIDAEFETVSVLVKKAQLNGPQTVQAARSFALKYWLRGRLMLPLGEPDADSINPVAVEAPKKERSKSIKEGVLKL